MPRVLRAARTPASLLLARLLLLPVFGPVFCFRFSSRRACVNQTNFWKKGEINMASGKTDELKGRVKEAAGALTDDAKLKREGRIDQKVGKVKQTTEKVIDKVRHAVK